MKPQQAKLTLAKVLDAGHGTKGIFFTLMSTEGKNFVHVQLPQGCAVFRQIEDPEAGRINNLLADVYDEGKRIASGKRKSG